MYIAVSTSLGSIAAGFGAIAAGSLLGILGSWSMVLAGKTFEGFHILFLASFIMRLMCTAILIPRIANYTTARN